MVLLEPHLLLIDLCLELLELCSRIQQRPPRVRLIVCVSMGVGVGVGKQRVWS